MATQAQQIEYVAILRDVRAGTTTREHFQARDYQEAKSRYAGRGGVRIVGVLPISAVSAGQVVTTLNPDESVGEIGHVVSGEDNSPAIRCFFE